MVERRRVKYVSNIIIFYGRHADNDIVLTRSRMSFHFQPDNDGDFTSSFIDTNGWTSTICES